MEGSKAGPKKNKSRRPSYSSGLPSSVGIDRNGESNAPLPNWNRDIVSNERWGEQWCFLYNKEVTKPNLSLHNLTALLSEHLAARSPFQCNNGAFNAHSD